MPYRNLTMEQMEAVRFDDNLLLSACPGSGKTKTLVSKLCYLLENKESLRIGKRKIVAITYTNVAADTIKERLLSYGIDSSALWIGTIHSFCLHWVIKPNINLIPRLCKGYVIIDEHEKQAKIDELKEKYHINKFERVETKLGLDYKPVYSRGVALFDLVREYHLYLGQNRLIDFDLIINLSYRLLKENSFLGRRLSKLFSHLLVDEYQDTSDIQYEILSSVVSRQQTTVTFVGDKEQAIYTGLGAVVKDKTDLKETFKLDSIAEKSLTGCFRSSQRIVDYYSNYQDGNIDIQSMSKLKDFASVVHLDNTIHKNDLAEYVANIIKTHLAQGIEQREIVVLCPSWFAVMELSRRLEEFSDDFSIDDFLVSPIPKNQDNIWLNLIRLALLEPSVENYIKRQRIAKTLSEFLYDIRETDELIQPKKILRAVNSLSIKAVGAIEKWIERIIKDFYFKLNLEYNNNSLGASSMRSLLDATAQRMKSYSMNYEASDLHRFFCDPSGVKITSCHSTKGDEYDVVICTGLLKGKVPHWQDIRNRSMQHQNYVARRLLYVVASRAKKHLYMISENGYVSNSGYHYVKTEQL